MRRLITTTVLSLTLLTAAACGGDPATPEAGSSAAASAAASAAPAAATGSESTAQSCLRAAQANLKMQTATLAGMGKAVGALEDPAKAAEAIGLLRKALTDFTADLAKISADTSDSEVKAVLDAELVALDQAAKAVDAANGDVDKAMDALDVPELEAAWAKVDGVCGS